MIDGIIMNGRYIIIPDKLQKQAPEQLLSYHMGIKRLLACELIYWINMNAHIENAIKCYDFNVTCLGLVNLTLVTLFPCDGTYTQDACIWVHPSGIFIYCWLVNYIHIFTIMHTIVDVYAY